MIRMKPISIAFVTAFIFAPGIALADPPQITDDEGYARLARWESHLDQRIASGVHDRWLPADRAWRIQRELDNIEIQLVKTYYDSDRGIDPSTFRRFAGQLRQVGSELGDNGWAEPDYRDQDYGSPPTYGPGPGGYGPPPAPPPQPYYQAGNYEDNCRHGNALAGTIFGAIGGGLIGGAASHGNGGAVAGGVIVGGLLGNALSRDIDCADHQYAFSTYQQAFGGDINREYQWRHGDHYGTIVTTREYQRGPYLCRDFHAVNYRGGQRYERDGTACRQSDGYWHFD